MNDAVHASRAIVDLDAYARNLDYARQAAGEALALVAVVKADGYGLGALPLARRALDRGAAMLGVATVGEGIALREGGINAPVLVMVQPDPRAFAPALDHGLTLMLCDVDAARAIDALAGERGAVVPVHCMVDTGMGRQGFAFDTAAAGIRAVAGLHRLRLEGVGTHYPIADVGGDPFTRNQIEKLKALVRELEAAGVACGAVHGANSAGVVNFHDGLFSMIRPGIMTVGVWPTDQMPDPNPIRPVLRWVTRVSQVRDMAPGDSVSYARTYITDNGMKAAILPVGYADGYRLAFSNKAEVLIRGRRCPVRGRVCMDQTIVEVSHLPDVATGDEVTLAGVQGNDQITLEELAAHANTIPYEILTGIGRRVARVYVN